MRTALALLLAAGAVFRVVANEHGIEVSQRLDTHLIEFRADGNIDAPPERVRALMLDYGRAQALSKEVAECRVLRRGDHFIDVYQRLSLPVVDDRDYTLHVTWGEEGDVLWLRFDAANELGPAPRAGVVRVPLHHGSWRFAPGPNGSTQAHYEIRMDLGGSLPAFMARKGAGDSIPAFFEGLRRELRQPGRE